MCLQFVLAHVRKNGSLLCSGLSNVELGRINKNGGPIKKAAFDGRFIFNKDISAYHTDNRDFPNLVRTGYKIFGRRVSGIYFGKSYRLNKWYESPVDFVHSDDFNYYVAGFHIFYTLKDAEKYKSEQYFSSSKIYTVQYTNVTTLGIDSHDTDVVVARRMKILKEVPRDKNN